MDYEYFCIPNSLLFKNFVVMSILSKITFYTFFIVNAISSFGMSNDSLNLPKKNDDVKHRLFANIFASYYYGSTSIVPKTAFEMPTALLGYSANFSEKLKATLIYDVTRTTSSIEVFDGDGNPIDLNYFEGSKYTAFLKMAEIFYSINDYIDFRVGQLLNTQYLTTQDKFWGYRYIYFTYQEVHRYGNPADFGAQLDFKLGNKLINQFSITNGEGPFRHQDSSGKFLFSNNVEFRPIPGMVLKLYADFAPSPETVAEAKDKYAISAFAGYKTESFRFALEYNQVFNYGFRSNNQYYGVSSFSSVKLTNKFDILARYDYINKSNTLNIEKGHFLLGGVQFTPHKNFFCSLNIRSLNPGEKFWIYSSFSVSF
jgi:hypothetical protein